MRRYLLFAGDIHDQNSIGWDALYWDGNDLEFLISKAFGLDWWHIVDTETQEIVKRGGTYV